MFSPRFATYDTVAPTGAGGLEYEDVTRSVLVTGGCGYIGSMLVPELASRGWHVRILDCLLFGNRLPAGLLESGRAELVDGDIRHADVVARACEGVDAVVHLAAMANDPSADLDPALTRSINLDAVIALIDIARRAGVSRFVNASTATVYGVRDEPDVDETFEHRPITLYGKYKSETDHAVAAANGPNFTTVNIRSATVCGWSPRMRLDLSVNILTEQAVRRGTVTVHGGKQLRPNVVITDLVGAYCSVLEAPAAVVGGESFNIGASNLSILEIAREVIAAVNPSAQMVVDSTVDHRSYHISTRKAVTRLGFKPLLDVPDGARQVAEALRAGRIDRPDASEHRNVQHLQAIGFS
ncbi:MAG TPA: SDR family oxidoreductase [Vicinamibacterales bacterium]|nr:SDR family oxidoreductase [Vicinamibacterales bacterium]